MAIAWKSCPFWCFSIFATFSLWYLLFLCKSQLILSFTKISINERPVIAVVGQRLTKPGVLGKYPEAVGKSFVGAGYVKFIESAGARVLPVGVDTNITEVERIFANTNGLLLTGGSGKILSSNYERIAKRFIELIKEAYEQSDHYPLLGICLGLEEVVTLAVGRNVCRLTTTHNVGIPMKFTAAAEHSRMFHDIPLDIQTTLSTTKAAFHSHKYSILVDVFNKIAALRDSFNILSTSKDTNGIEFIASLEAKKYPIMGMHWRPEKTSFEWNIKYNIDRSKEALHASQFMGNRFVDIARKNMHEFSKDLEDKLIYHYVPFYTEDVSFYTQMYIF